MLMKLFFLLFGSLASGRVVTQNCQLKDNYIVGGHNISIKEAPYSVSITVGGSAFCGGFIINSTHIGTAAHCTDSPSGDYYTVRVGSNIHDQGGIIVPVKSARWHPDFGAVKGLFDAAVLELATPLTFTDSIQPIKLADVEPAAGSEAKACGWGRTGTSEPQSETLLAVTVPIIDRQKCKSYFPDSFVESEICAGGEKKGACFGDSGSALVYQNTAVGITSYGRIPCADYPCVYSNIAHPDIKKFFTGA